MNCACHGSTAYDVPWLGSQAIPSRPMRSLVERRAEDVLLVALGVIRSYAPLDGSGSRSVPGWFRAMTGALVAAGVLGRNDRARWNDGARGALAGVGRPTRPSRGLADRARKLASGGAPGWNETELLGLLGELGLARGDGELSERRWWLPAPAFGERVEFSARGLQRVIVPGAADGPVQLDSVCLYQDGLVVNVSGPARRAGDELADQVRVWWIIDDQGTEYASAGGGGNSGNGWPEGMTLYFTPAVPRRAKRLFVAFGAVEAEIGLDDG